MTNPLDRRGRIARNRLLWAAFILAMTFVLTVCGVQAHAQTYSILHTFTGSDGSSPTSTLIPDGRGNLYGTTEYGGSLDAGTVFELKRSDSGWVLNTLYSFTGIRGGDGAYPVNYGGLTVGPDGAFYGTTVQGGVFSGSNSLGTVFIVRPSPTRCQTAQCPWSDEVLHEFAGHPNDGEQPSGNVAFDSAGNLYGTTTQGSTAGSIFEMSPSNGEWTERIIPGTTVGEVDGGVALDPSGNLYAACRYCGTHGKGAIVQVARSGFSWTTNILYSFTGNADGGFPVGGLILDHAGNIYGSTESAGSGFGGTVFQLSPEAGGGWTFNLLCSLGGTRGPQSALARDASGNLYGTTMYDDGGGSVFKVANNGSGWTCISLHDFSQDGQGVAPVGGVAVDANGNVFGTTSGGGGSGNGGVIFEITP